MEKNRLKKGVIGSVLLLVVFMSWDTPAQTGLYKLQNGQIVRDSLRVKVITKVQTNILRSPDLSSNMVKEVKQFQVLNVFSASNSVAKLKDGNFYRVGIADEPLGWMHQNSVVEWDHRQCVKLTPQRGRQLASVYKEKELITVISKEIEGSASENKYFPLLEPPKSQIVNGALQKLYHVAYLNWEGTTHGGLDIVFVMDTTRSMQPYIEGAKQVVAEMAKEIHSKGGTVRFGLVAYRDRVNNQTEMEYIVKHLSTLTPNIKSFLSILDQTKEANISSEEVSECMYDGLYEAITKSDWGVSPRAIVLIGDASAHEPGSYKNTEGYSADQLWKALGDRNIRMVAIQIEGGFENDYEKHRRQLETLIRERELRGGTLHIVERGQEGRNQFEFRSILKGQLREKLPFIDLVKEAAQKLASGDSNPSPPPGVSVSDWVYVLKPAQQIVQKEGGFVFSTGWLPESIDGRKLVETRVMITRSEMDLLLSHLFAVTGLLRDPTEGLVASTIAVMEKHAGEKFSGSFEELAQRQGLPVKEGLLRFNPREVLNWSQTKAADQLKLVEEKRGLLSRFYDTVKEWKDNIAFVPIEYLP